MRLHRIRNDQLYHYYPGDPLELFLLHEAGRAERVIVGPDLRDGHQVQLLIPGGTFHTARLLGTGRWFLGGSTEWPGVVPAEDVEIGNLDELAAAYPAVGADLRVIAASARHVPPNDRGSSLAATRHGKLPPFGDTKSDRLRDGVIGRSFGRSCGLPLLVSESRGCCRHLELGPAAAGSRPVATAW